MPSLAAMETSDKAAVGSCVKEALQAETAPESLERIAHQAESAGASDIHIQMRGKEADLVFRLDGVMTAPSTIPEGLAERICGRIKYLARLKTYQESLPQDGRIDRKDLGIGSDVRVATYPTVTGEKIVLRLFKTTEARTLAALELPEEATAMLERFLGRSSGMLLLTGPAGSGKTTTIYSCLRHLQALGGRHIITVEDPVEQVLPGIMQTEVNEARGLDFACASRHLLRQDPQVLVIGEIRDEATAQVALRAALTGHLVISTLHAGSCRGVFERLSAFVPDLSTIAASVDLVLNQRLIRRKCSGCEGKGCAQCLGTGFRGRIPLIEWLSVTDEIRAHVRDRAFQSITPLQPMEVLGREWVERGLTVPQELARVL